MALTNSRQGLGTGLAFFSIKMSSAVIFLFRVLGRENSGAKPAETTIHKKQ